MSVLMLLAALLALREAARVDTASSQMMSAAPVTTAPTVVEPEAAPTSAPPVASAAAVVPVAGASVAGPISLEDLASEALEEAATATTVERRAVRTTTTTTTVTRRATTTVKQALTTTTVKKSTTTVAPAARAGTPGARNQTGAASWFNAPDGSCAHNVIPKGTTVTVTRLSTGASTTCYIDQGGPSDTTRIIDLSMDTFEKLAAPGVGLIEVRIEW